MDDGASALDAASRLPIFLFAFAALALWEAIAPRRLTVRASLADRWRVNMTLFVVNNVLLHLLVPGLAVAVAAVAASRQIGLFAWLELPSWIAGVATWVALDFLRFFHHWLLHRVKPLWRLHRPHHSDPEYDITTGLRFHPAEAVFGAALGLLGILALGGPVVAVLASEIWATVTALFTHANVALPPRLEAVLRRVVVTPDLHRIHHSIRRDEAGSNLGNTLVLWDRLFGTYRAAPADGHAGMTLGLPEYRTPDRLRLGRLLADPFLRAP